MEKFGDDDEAYITWVRTHRDGFVVNCARTPAPNYLILHRADCRTITGSPAVGDTWTEGDYIKVCAEARWDLQKWAREEVGEQLTTCGVCGA